MRGKDGEACQDKLMGNSTQWVCFGGLLLMGEKSEGEEKREVEKGEREGESGGGEFDVVFWGELC